MIDGIKLSFYSQTIIEDLSRLGVRVVTPLVEDTGEILFPKTAEYKSLRFKISETTRVEISGSLHKYFIGENHSDFTFRALCQCICDLCQKLTISPLEAKLHGLEFGVNVSVGFSPYEFCNHVIAYKTKSFAKFRTERSLEIGFEAKSQQYRIKVYEKGKNLLRFEIKVTRMAFLKGKGIAISSLSDLTDPYILAQLGKLLNEVFEECIISDTVKLGGLTANEERIYNQYNNPKIWERLSFRDRYRKRKQFEKIVETKGANKWKKITAQLIRDKWLLLSSIKPKSVEDLTDLPKRQRGEFNRLGKQLNPPLRNQGYSFCYGKFFRKRRNKHRNKGPPKVFKRGARSLKLEQKRPRFFHTNQRCGFSTPIFLIVTG